MRSPDPRTWFPVAAAAGVALVLVLAAQSGSFGRTTPGVPAPLYVKAITDETGMLRPAFVPGVVLAVASNDTSVMLGGIGVYLKSSDYELPVLASITKTSAGFSVANLTPAIVSTFWHGGVYGIGWNGSSWLIAGQASWGGGNFGAMVAVRGSATVNLTATIFRYFAGGGIFALGWNGTSWLIGGNSSSGVVLVAWQNGRISDLSAEVHSSDPLGWIQSIRWNGFEWLIGGQGVFSLLLGPVMIDLFSGSPFQGSGVWASDWNGLVWLAGGGGGKSVIISGLSMHPGPTLPAGFDQAVLMVIATGGSWILGGKGSTPRTSFAPEMVEWSGSAGSSGVVDLSSGVPASFAGGEIQGGGWAPTEWGMEILLAGEGGYNGNSGLGDGALAVAALTAE